MAVRILIAGFRPAHGGGAGVAPAGQETTTRVLANCAMQERAAGPEGEGFAVGVRLAVLELPPSYRDATQAIRTALTTDPPDDLLLLGTDAGSSEHKLHVLAANYADDPAPDADGSALTDTIIDPDGPVAYRSRLPLDGIWDKFLVERVPVRMSHKAGLGLFNHAFYTAMRMIDVEGLAVRAGAMETPPLPGDETGDAEPRPLAALMEELLMVVSVLAQLHPAGSKATGAKAAR